MATRWRSSSIPQACRSACTARAHKRAQLFRLRAAFRQVRFTLLAHDVEEVAHRQVHVDEVQPPVREYGRADADVAGTLPNSVSGRHGRTARCEGDDAAGLSGRVTAAASG